jgi:hypothetical protein
MDNNNLENISNIFHCEICDYSTSRKFNLTTHYNSVKHKNNTISKNHNSCLVKPNNNICENCGKQLCDRVSLWRHKKRCKVPKEEIKTPINIKEFFENNDPIQIINYLLKENSEFKNMLFEQNKQLIEMAKNANSHNTTNSHNNNKTFNLQVFLNETCKDAMNISDFVSSIKVSLEDLERTGEKGYVEGISNIFIKNLNQMEQHLRPMHCSDSKREVLYIKNNNEWIKEKEDKPILVKAIKAVAHENIKLIKTWTEKYPDCMKPTNNKNDAYLRIVSNAMNGLTDDESLTNIQKVVSCISKEVIIDKTLALAN